jgi:hypothetical protein
METGERASKEEEEEEEEEEEDDENEEEDERDAVKVKKARRGAEKERKKKMIIALIKELAPSEAAAYEAKKQVLQYSFILLLPISLHINKQINTFRRRPWQRLTSQGGGWRKSANAGYGQCWLASHALWMN